MNVDGDNDCVEVEVDVDASVAADVPVEDIVVDDVFCVDDVDD